MTILSWILYTMTYWISYNDTSTQFMGNAIHWHFVFISTSFNLNGYTMAFIWILYVMIASNFALKQRCTKTNRKGFQMHINSQKCKQTGLFFHERFKIKIGILMNRWLYLAEFSTLWLIGYHTTIHQHNLWLFWQLVDGNPMNIYIIFDFNCFREEHI
jgi:hypothetical protein